MKNTWINIKNILGKNKAASSSPNYFINDKNEQVVGNENIANNFNQYFVNVGPNLAGSIKTDISPKSFYNSQVKLQYFYYQQMMQRF